MNQAEAREWLKKVPTKLLASEYNSRIAKKRKPSGAGGRPPKLVPCPNCGAKVSTRTLTHAKERAEHAIVCDKA